VRGRAGKPLTKIGLRLGGRGDRKGRRRVNQTFVRNYRSQDSCKRKGKVGQGVSPIQPVRSVGSVKGVSIRLTSRFEKVEHD